MRALPLTAWLPATPGVPPGAAVPRSGLFRVFRQVARGAVMLCMQPLLSEYTYLPNYKTIKMEHMERLEQGSKINGLRRSTAGTIPP